MAAVAVMTSQMRLGTGMAPAFLFFAAMAFDESPGKRTPSACDAEVVAEARGKFESLG